MTINDEMKIREMYKAKTENDIQLELERLNAEPFGTFDFNNSEISHFNLKKVLKEVMAERYIAITNPAPAQNNSPYNLNGIPGQNIINQPNVNRTNSPNGGVIGLGIVLFSLGVVITMSSGGQVITYGLIVIGFFKIIQGFIGD